MNSNRGQRLLLSLMVIVLAGLLITARLLAPDPAGVGTHRQLGLPGCTLLTVFGIRCPACGMTTAWSHTVRGNLPAAVQASLSGCLLCCYSVVLVLLSVFCLLWYRGSPSKLLMPWSGYVLAGLAVICASEWLFRLALA